MSVVAVFARILRAGVTFDEYTAAWAPPSWSEHLGELDVGVDPVDDRRVITVVRFAGTIDEFWTKLPEMVRPDAIEQLEKVVESTELNSVYETRALGFPR